MLKSMTGYGKGEGLTSLGKVQVEVRSLNHRFLELNIKIPRYLMIFESKIRELIAQYIKRGKVDLYLRIDQSERGPFKLKIDWKLLESYFNALKELKARYKIKGEITFSDLINMGLISLEEPEMKEEMWEDFEPIIKKALAELVGRRILEGERILEEIKERLRIIESLIGEIENRASEFPEYHRQKLLERLSNLCRGLELDEKRLEQEVAFLVEKSDIREEIVRLKSHVQSFREELQKEEPIGKALDFLLQEMNREANTIASKSPDFAVIKSALKIREEVEKLREQVQNVE